MAKSSRPSGLIGAVLVIIGLFGVGAGLGQLAGAPGLPSVGLANGRPTTPAARPMARSTPTKIIIPSIGVYAPIMSLGVAADGTIATPPLNDDNLAGWFSRGPTPGQNGPAIILGHVDGPKGDAVFYRLSELKLGQKVQIDLANHRVAVFSVYSVEYYPKGKFPGSKVYGDYSRPGLRLITCGGKYVGGPVGYEDNVVAYASLVMRG